MCIDSVLVQSWYTHCERCALCSVYKYIFAVMIFRTMFILRNWNIVKHCSVPISFLLSISHKNAFSITAMATLPWMFFGVTCHTHSQYIPTRHSHSMLRIYFVCSNKLLMLKLNKIVIPHTRNFHSAAVSLARVVGWRCFVMFVIIITRAHLKYIYT